MTVNYLSIITTPYRSTSMIVQRSGT